MKWKLSIHVIEGGKVEKVVIPISFYEAESQLRPVI